MPSELIFEDRKTQWGDPKVLVRRPAQYPADRRYTIGKIRYLDRRQRKLVFQLNGQDHATLEELSEIYLVMAEMTERLSGARN